MSIDSQKFELEKLQKDIENLKEEHAAALKKKAEEFERWIGQKEQSIEEEVERRKEVEKDLETAKVEIADLNKQLEQKDTKITSLEDVVIDEHNKYMDIVKAKKDIESKLATQVSIFSIILWKHSSGGIGNINREAHFWCGQLGPRLPNFYIRNNNDIPENC